MEIPKREQKIFDFFLYWKERDMLLLRLNELNDFITDFVIIEFDLNFKLNHYKKFLDLSSPDFDNFRHKITHLKLEFRNYDEYYNSQMKKLKLESLDLHERFFVRTFDEIQKFLENYDVDFEDIILFSHVDEIPDLVDLEKIKSFLIYGPVVLKNHNFVHTIKYFQESCHTGTQIYNYSMIVRNSNILFEIYVKKFLNVKNMPVTFIKSGWHLSQFFEIEEVVENLNNCSLIYHQKFDSDRVVKNISKLKPLTEISPKMKFKKTNIKLPKSLKYVNTNSDFEISNFVHLIAIESAEIDGNYDTVNFVEYTTNPSLPFESNLNDNVTTYNLLIPREKIYESENFFEEYKINEIKLIIQWLEPLDNDKIVIRTQNSSKEFYWYEIKELELYTVM